MIIVVRAQSLARVYMAPGLSSNFNILSMAAAASKIKKFARPGPGPCPNFLLEGII